MLAIQRIEQITSFDWTDFPDCDMDTEALMAFWKSHHLTGVSPVKNAVDGVYRLHEAQKKLHIITARNEHDHRSDTERWMKQYFPEIPSHHIHFANHLSKQNHKKSTLCKELGITLLVDDGGHNALDVIEAGIHCILLDRPWNQHITIDHPHLHRMKNWTEILSHLHTV